MICKEVERENSKMAMMLEQQKKLLHDKEKAYLDLEEEFRLALRIEASRYNELQASHQVRYKQNCFQPRLPCTNQPKKNNLS